MNIDKIKAFNLESIDIRRKGWDELPNVMDDYWERLSDFIATDIQGAIEFLLDPEKCTVDVFLDWSEVFDDVVRKSQSRDFLAAVRKAAERFPSECDDYDIHGVIAFAEGELKA